MSYHHFTTTTTTTTSMTTIEVYERGRAPGRWRSASGERPPPAKDGGLLIL